uniref:DDE-1 domain-containing protein n=1 Tax=Hippocampus comes TaxID=109280 RepID=A0A3Q3D7L5_HIPCM
MSPKLSAPLVYFGPKLKRKRKVMPLYEKVKILNLLRDGKTFSAVARCYGLNESTIRSIKKEEANIRSTVAINGSQTLKRVVNTRNNAHRGKEDNGTNPQPGPSTSSEEPIEFLASKGWFDRFRKRYQLKSVSPHWESASADVEAARKYPETFKALIEEKGYKPEQVFNMNETGLFWKKIPTRMLLKEEARAPEFKGQNDRVVLIMCCNAAGFLMKPALIYKSANPRSLKSKDKNLLPVFWMHNSKVSLTKPLVAEWFHESFLPQAKSYLSEKGLDFNICLMMDNVSSLPLNLSYEGVRIEILPANIQPLDQGLIWIFKALYARNVMQQLVNARDTEENVSVGELWKNFNIATALQVIQICLQELKPGTVSACWKKLWPECVPEVEGSSTDEVQRLAVDKAVKLAELVGGEGFRNMTPDDLNDLLETHSNPMTDDDSAHLPKQAGEEAEQEADTSQEEDEVEGLSLERLSVMVKTAKDLQGMVDAWDPNMVRALQFKSAIDSAMQTYRTLLTTMKKQREKFTVTQDKPTSASSEEAPDYQELLALLPSEAPEEEASYEEL